MPTVSSNGTAPSTARDWKAVFQDWKKSGLTQVDFCAERGLSIHAFRGVRYGKRWPRVRFVAQRKRVTGFVPVRVVAQRSGSGLALLPPTVSVLELVLAGGRVVRIPSGFDEHLLARVIAVVEERTC